MSIKTVHVEPGLAVVLRRGFEAQTDSNDQPVVTSDGEQVFVAEAILPGKVRGSFGLDNDDPAGVRLKTIGSNPGMAAGQTVRLQGRVTLTAWYSPRARGNDARSDLTVTAERVEPANGAQAVLRGGIPAVFPADVDVTLLATRPDGACDVMLSAASSYVVDGVAQIRCTGGVPAGMAGQTVRPIGLRAFFVTPDREDVGQRSKAELFLSCTGFERAGGAGFSPRPRKNDPAPEAAVEAAA